MANGAIGGQGGVLQPVKDGIGCNNPVLCQALGICSALAVTGYVKPTVVMGAALLFVASFSSLAVSLLRKRPLREAILPSSSVETGAV